MGVQVAIGISVGTGQGPDLQSELEQVTWPRFESEQEYEFDFQLDLTYAKLLLLAIDLVSGLEKGSEWYDIGFRLQTRIGT